MLSGTDADGDRRDLSLSMALSRLGSALLSRFVEAFRAPRVATFGAAVDAWDCCSRASILRRQRSCRAPSLLAWRHGHSGAQRVAPERLAAIREQLKLLADYL